MANVNYLKNIYDRFAQIAILRDGYNYKASGTLHRYIVSDVAIYVIVQEVRRILFGVAGRMYKNQDIS